MIAACLNLGYPLESCAVLFSRRRRHTRWPRDWSSDVCSSDLVGTDDAIAAGGERARKAIEVAALPAQAVDADRDAIALRIAPLGVGDPVKMLLGDAEELIGAELGPRAAGEGRARGSGPAR